MSTTKYIVNNSPEQTINGDMNITGVINSGGMIQFSQGSQIESIANSSSDGLSASTIVLKPDSSLDTDQYIILDPTAGGPNHIHIRAGGDIDSSSVDLIIGGEDNNLRVSDTDKTVQINSNSLYTQDSASFSVGPNYDSATWSGNLITITNPDSTLINFINGYQVGTDVFRVFYDNPGPVSMELSISNKDISNYPTHVLTVDAAFNTNVTQMDIQINRYQSGRVIADNGTVTIQAGDTVAPENWVFGMTGGVGTLTFPDNSVQTTAYAPPTYKVYTAILTQSGTSSENTLINTDLTIGVTYQILDQGSEIAPWDFTNVGAPNNNVGTYFIATGTTPTSWGNDVGLFYNTGAPVVTVLENTIGNIWWTYFNIGDYACWSDDLFTIGKTTVFIGPENYFISDTSNLSKLVVFAEEQFTDYIEFLLCDPNGRIDGLINKSIEIRVYN